MLQYLKKYKKECVLAPLFKMYEALLDLLVPLVVASIIDRGIVGGNAAHIWRMCGLLVALALVGLAAAVVAQYFAAKAATGFAADVRHTLFARLTALSFPDVDRVGVPAMMTRMTSDVNQAQTGVNMALRLLLRSPFVVLGAMVMAFTIDAKCALIFVAVIGALSLVVYAIMAANIPMMAGVQRQLEAVLAATRENLAGVRVIRAFGREDAEFDAFRAKNRELTRRQRRAGHVSALLNPVTYVLINAAVIVLVRQGAIRVDSGALTTGAVVALYNYLSQILVELVKFASLTITINKAWASWKRIEDALALEPSIPDPGSMAEAPNPAAPAVQFRHVCLTYPGAASPALQDVDFTAWPGQTVGIIGGTGAGKTSLTQLICRLYDVTAGAVRVGGIDVRRYDLETLRNQVAMVLQKNVLFSGTIAENLRWGKADATQEELERVCRLAQAEEFIKTFPDGYETHIEQGGANVSGGQRQRLCIARALLKDPKILILDDSTSAVDTRTDALLRASLRETLPNTTKIIIAQRISSVQDADMIVVLDNGRVNDCGTHDELMARCEIYREVAETQQKAGDPDEA